MTKTSLSIVLAVRDAAGQLAALAAECLAVAARHTPDYELIIVVDGGDDATRAQAARIAATHAPVVALHHRRRLGFRHALRDARRIARGDSVLALDPRQVPVSELPKLLALAGGYVAVFGARRPTPARARLGALGGAGVRLRDPALRLVLADAGALDFVGPAGPDALVTGEIAAGASRQGQTFTQVEIAARHGTGAGQRQRTAVGLGTLFLAGCLWLLRRWRPAGGRR